MAFSASPPPARIRTDRLVLRCWQPADAPRLKEAIDWSLDHLRPWMPWAHEEPSEVEVLVARLTSFRDEFLAGHNFIYGIFDDTEVRVLGGTGLHPRRGPGVLEIGYWIRIDAVGRGYATEAARALTAAAFEHCGVGWVEIRCDPNNAASAAIPRRLGYRLREILERESSTPDGRPRDTMVWELRPADHAATRAT